MSIKRVSQTKNKVKNVNTPFSVFTEHCNFCILSFHTRAELKAHILTHFKTKTCLKTQKTLILVADDWYELHISHGCTSELCDSEKIANPVHITEYVIKEVDEVDEEPSLVRDSVLSDVGSTNVSIKSEDDLDFDGNSTISTEKEATKVETMSKNSKSKTLKSLNSSFPTKKSLSKSKPTKCKICKVKIPEGELMLHLTTRHVPKVNEIPTCETCGKTFSTPGNLRSHQYLHAERGRYICSYCGKDFVRNANLKEHINLHTGARPFECDVCKKTFHRETLLRNHKRIHTGEKKYRCDIENCERAYMVHIDLKRHKFSAHGIYTKKHTCFICSKVFSENKLLKKHLEAH